MRCARGGERKRERGRERERERERERGRERGGKLCRASKKFSDQVRACVINAPNVEFQKDAVEASRNRTKRGTRAPFLFPRAERPLACDDALATRSERRGEATILR